MASDPTPDAAPRPRPRLDRRAVAICACIALLAAIVAGIVATTVLKDDEAPTDRLELIDVAALRAVELTTIDGKPTSLEQLQDGRPILVNLWQQTCIPCVREMPLLEQASQQNTDVDVLGIDVQDRLEHAIEMADQTGITYPWVQDPEADFAYESRGTTLPRTLLFGADGSLVATQVGDFKTLDEIQAFLDRNLR